ncbi:MAG: hypothetical protein EYC70_11345 [Planctomycetota bacterium]|nr:MAG: hypothetical protein EYC70_11345 [Planctomycetota bacterium]
MNALLLTVLAQAAAAPQAQPLSFDPMPDQLAAVDLNGDGARELLSVRGARLSLARPDGTVLTLEVPAAATQWTVADHDNDRRDDFLVLVDGESLQRLILERDADGAETLAWSPPLLEGLGGHGLTPRGVRPADFVRDLDQDGRADLVVPLGGRVRLYFGSGAGFAPGPDLDVAARLELEAGGLYAGGLLGRAARRLSVPALRLRDISGDGLPDLSVTDGYLMRQYISSADGLPAEPTVTVDLERFQEKLGEIKFDPRNVAGLARFAVFHHWVDVNQDGARDLIVLFGGNVLVFLGGRNGLDMRRPVEQLRASGNVLYALAMPVDRDPIPDLVLIRIEDISLAQLVKILVLSFSLKLEILSYKGLGNGRFEQSPLPEPFSRKLEVDSPSILKLYGDREEGDALRRTVVRLADFDGDGRRTDLALLDDQGELRGYRNLVPDLSILDTLTDKFVADLLRRRSDVELDTRTLMGWLLGRSSVLVSLTEGRKPFFRLPAPPDWSQPQAMGVHDFDGDGRDEILMLRRFGEEIRNGADEVVKRKARLVGFLVDPDQPAQPR